MKKEEQHLSIYLIVVDTTIGNFLCFWTVTGLLASKKKIRIVEKITSNM
jgi:hypothetical protein